MKVAVVFLVVLGLLAAVSASLLVSALAKPGSVAQKNSTLAEVEILVAARDLSAMSVVEGSAVKTKRVPKALVSDQMLTNSVQVVGRIVTADIVEGAAFTKSTFDAKQAGVYLAAALPRGKRAMSISLPDWSGMAGLLYPGSVVDLLVSLKPSSSEVTSDDTISTTLLQGLQVLAIGAQSVASDARYENKDRGALASKGQVNHRMITLLVDPKQAEVLQLAAQHGSIALAMRNPMDIEREEQRLTRSSELSSLGEPSPGVADRLAQAAAAVLERAAEAPPPQPTPAVATAPEKPDLWETTIIRGGDTEKRTFPLVEAEEPPADTDREPEGAPNVAASERTDDARF